MSIQYLHNILPLKDIQSSLDQNPNPSETPHSESLDASLLDLSEHEIGILASRFETFASSITPIREKLEPVERFLASFNDEVRTLSESLLSLRNQSSKLSTNLDSQRHLVDTLNPIILDLIIPPTIAESVVKDPVDESWLENIRFITEKSQLISKVSEALDSGNQLLAHYKDIAAFHELKVGITALEAKAVERIRDHMIGQIRLLRKSPNLSSQVVQSKLLLIKDAFLFLKERHQDLANQLQLAYIFTMKWYYSTRFVKYLYALQKLKIKHIDSVYVLGGNDTSDSRPSGLLSGLMDTAYSSASASAAAVATLASPSLGSTQPSTRPTLNEYFSSAPKRLEVLNNSDSSQRRSIPSQIAETTPFAYWLEFPFNQWSNAVLDNVIVEYLFFIDFFLQGDEKNLPVQDLDPRVAIPAGPDQTWSQVMFSDVFKMGKEFVDWLMSYHPYTLGSRIGGVSAYGSTGDVYAILIMIRIVQNAQYVLHNELHVPVMDDYHNGLLLLLWPQFSRLVDLNCDALKNDVTTSSTYSFRSSSKNQAPLGVTQQFSQFITGLLKLAFVNDVDREHHQSFKGEPIGMAITRLRNDFEGALTRASNRMFGSKKGKSVEKEIFLFNNYFLALTILKNEFDDEASRSNEFITEQLHHFEMLCDAYKQQ